MSEIEYYFTEYVWCVDVDVAVVALEERKQRGGMSLSPCRLEQKVVRAKAKGKKDKKRVCPTKDRQSSVL